MANTKKATTKTEETAVTTVGMEQENAELKKQLATMQEQIAALMAMQTTKAELTQPTVQKKNKRKIAFYNMLPNEIVFKGTKLHTLAHQFDKAVYNESEAQEIVGNMYNAISNGYLYIADRQFVEENDLETIYEDLLSNEQLADLLNHDSQYVIDVYKSVCEGQKRIIVDMLVNKKLAGEAVDANVLLEIGKLSSRDLIGIEPFADQN